VIFKSDYINLRMPSWTPGSYLLREFAKSVERVEAKGNGRELQYQRTDKNTWRFSTKGMSEFNAVYHVYAFEWSVRTSFIDQDMAFLHNTSMFMLVEPFAHLSGIVEVELPEAWQRINTSLEQMGKQGRLHEFRFSNYDELSDEPILAGNQDTFSFRLNGVAHTVAISGKGNHDMVVFKKDLQKVCKETEKIFGEHPCKHYTFFVLNTESGGGGLEHANSCTVMMPRWQWNNESRYKQFLGLCAHEYFHLWNVKRIRPEALGPFDYSRENHTNMLWVAEGITSYYDELIMRRAGYYTREEYLSKTAATINDLESRPGRNILTLNESSWDAWIREYRPNENSRNTAISYYLKGQVVAFMLDASIVANTNGARNLDDVMRALWKQWKNRPAKGFTDDEFTDYSIQRVATADMKPFMQQYVFGLSQPDYAGILLRAGVTAENKGKKENTLGCTAASENGRLVVKYVERGLGAWNAGLSVNDEIIAVNGIRTISGLDDVYRLMQPGDTAELLISRSGLVRNLRVPFIAREKPDWKLQASGEKKSLAARLLD
jgi:predicted metalloprotease with PDZ domain